MKIRVLILALSLCAQLTLAAPKSVFSPMMVSGHLHLKVCGTLLATYPDHKLDHDLPVFAVEETLGAVPRTTRTSFDSLMEKARRDHLGHPYADYLGVEAVQFGVRTPDNREYRVSATPPVGLAKAWNWVAYDYFDIDPYLVASTEGSQNVEELQEIAAIPVATMIRISRFDLEAEMLDLPHNPKGKSTLTDDIYYSYQYSKPRYFRVKSPKTGLPIGYLVLLDLTEFYEEENLAAGYKSHFRGKISDLTYQTKLFRYLAHFDLKGNRVEPWRREGPLAVPVGRVIDRSNALGSVVNVNGRPTNQPLKVAQTTLGSGWNDGQWVPALQQNPIEVLPQPSLFDLTTHGASRDWQRGATGTGPFTSFALGWRESLGGVQPAAIAPDGSYAFLPGRPPQNNVLIDLRTGKTVQRYQVPGNIVFAKFSHNGEQIYVGLKEGYLVILDVESGALRQLISLQPASDDSLSDFPVTNILELASGHLVADAGFGRDSSTFLVDRRASIATTIPSPGSSLFVAQGFLAKFDWESGFLRVPFGTDQGKPVFTAAGPSTGALRNSIQLRRSPQGAYRRLSPSGEFFTAVEDGSLAGLFHFDGTVVTRLSIPQAHYFHEDRAACSDSGADGTSKLVSIGSDGTARYWPIDETGTLGAPIPLINEAIQAIMSPNGSYVAITTAEDLSVWSVTGVPVRLATHKAPKTRKIWFTADSLGLVFEYEEGIATLIAQ